MQKKSFPLDSTSLSYTFSFEHDMLSCELFKKVAECRIDQITKVVQKNTSMGLGEELSFRIYYLENGKEKKFPWIPVLITSQNGIDFFEELKNRVSPQVIWEDKRVGNTVDESGGKIFDIQFLPLGYSGSGLSRGVQIWMYLFITFWLIFPLIYLIKVLAIGGYKIYASDNQMELRKFGSKKIAWNDIDDITFQQVTVRDQQNFQSNQVLKIVIYPKNGRKIKFVMRYDFAMPFMKELASHGVIKEEDIGRFNS